MEASTRDWGVAIAIAIFVIAKLFDLLKQNRKDGRDDIKTIGKRVSEFERRFEGRDVPRPPYWSGFRLVPSSIEFWKGKPSRLHDRQLYTRDGDGWRVTLLYP
mgnify:CR=1 FL=1